MALEQCAEYFPAVVNWIDKAGFSAPIFPVPQPADSPGDPRVYLAVERTFLAWIRTGIALMGFGFVVARFGLFLRELAASQPAPSISNSGFSLPAGILLISLGILIMLVASIRHHRLIKAIDRGQFRPAFGSFFIFCIAALLAVFGVAVAIYLIAVY